MSEPTGSDRRCNAPHWYTDTRCIRTPGHAGNCWGPWETPPSRPGYLVQTRFAGPTEPQPGDHRGYYERFIGKQALR